MFSVALLTANACAATLASKTYCGVRSGTAGNAFLDASNERNTLTLAEQGGSPKLLDEIDILIGPYKGETGTQNGQRYCAVVTLDSSGKPSRVIKAWRQHK